MPRIGGAGAQAERSPLRTAIDTKMIIIAVPRRAAIAHIEGGAAIAAESADADAVESKGVAAGQGTASGSAERRGVAIAIGGPPGAEALSPERQAIRRSSHRRAISGIGGKRSGGGTDSTEGGTNAIDRRVPHKAAVVDQHALGRRINFAGEPIEGILRLRRR